MPLSVLACFGGGSGPPTAIHAQKPREPAPRLTDEVVVLGHELFLFSPPSPLSIILTEVDFLFHKPLELCSTSVFFVCFFCEMQPGLSVSEVYQGFVSYAGSSEVLVLKSSIDH